MARRGVVFTYERRALGTEAVSRVYRFNASSELCVYENISSAQVERVTYFENYICNYIFIGILTMLGVLSFWLVFSLHLVPSSAPPSRPFEDASHFCFAFLRIQRLLRLYSGSIFVSLSFSSTQKHILGWALETMSINTFHSTSEINKMEFNVWPINDNVRVFVCFCVCFCACLLMFIYLYRLYEWPISLRMNVFFLLMMGMTTNRDRI